MQNLTKRFLRRCIFLYLLLGRVQTQDSPLRRRRMLVEVTENRKRAVALLNHLWTTDGVVEASPPTTGTKGIIRRWLGTQGSFKDKKDGMKKRKVATKPKKSKSSKESKKKKSGSAQGQKNSDKKNDKKKETQDFDMSFYYYF